MRKVSRTPSEWFEAATHCYVEGHQACAWCGGAHQVHRTEAAASVEYRCNYCDFAVRHEVDVNCYTIVPGETSGRPLAPATMHDF